MNKLTLNIAGSIQILNFVRNLTVLLFALVFIAPLAIQAQSTQQPKRGLYEGGSYSVSNLEAVNIQSGGLMYNFPLASLPQGRGGGSAGISLNYNSKIWDPQSFRMDDGCTDPDCHTRATRNFNFVYPSRSGGGWSYSLFYKLEQFNQDTEDRSGPKPDRCMYGENNSSSPTPDPYMIRQRIRMPDGSTVDFRAEGELDVNGYFRYDIAGRYYRCVLRQPSIPDSGYLDVSAPTYQPKTYFSVDGSHLRLDTSYSAPDQNNQRSLIWKLYYPDGSRVESMSDGGFENVTYPYLYNGISNERYDRNGNRTVVLKNGSLVTVTDSVGREIKITNFGLTEEHVISSGTDGVSVEWKVKWKEIQGGDAIKPSGDAWYGTTPGAQTIRVVDQITTPTQLGSQVYTFEYNQDSTGALHGTGELSRVNFPTGAHTEYFYDTDGQTTLTTGKMLGNFLKQKKLTYQTEADGVPQPETIEDWTYTRTRSFNATSGMPEPVTAASTTTPDGGQTNETYYGDFVGNRLRTRTGPDGTMTENVWATEPTYSLSYPYTTAYNPYLKSEWVWLKSTTDPSGTFSKVTVKSFANDQNGNTTQIKEYDWLTGNITRNQSGEPQLPANQLPSRITSSIYANATLDASSTDVSSSYIYRKNTSPSLKNAPISTETSNGSGTVAARTEFSYDNPSTTGNVTEVKSWDSYKNGSNKPYSNPLTATNSISIITTYNSFGMPTLTTDAKGYQTQITYGTIPGPNSTSFTDLYPTQVVSAYGTSIAQTTQTEYDFYTGLPKKVTALGNTTNENVSSEMVYDAVGRPTISKAATDTPNEVWTQTSYDDTLRRIITKSDLFVKGDGKKVSIQHFDQIGRVRLSRTLENPATESATNEQDGIKVQTRYKAGDPNSYQLVSNPYRAATSGSASGEPSMGWTMSKSVNTGKHAETETFSGAGLPTAFGGSNTSSTGVVKTDIDLDRTLVTDQAGKQRISKSNALGQMTDVWEITAADSSTVAVSFLSQTLSTGYQTSYEYNTLNNLTTVIQGTQTNRTFAYSSLSRLTSAYNPESGTIAYQYDNNGNLTSKTDARTVVTAYTYDELNRVKTRNYSAPTGLQNYQAAPNVTYTYDNGTNARGRLTKVTNGFSTTEYTGFDILGRVTSSQQTTDSAAYPAMTYTYNLSGALIEEKYPSGRVVKNVLDSNGDLTIVQSKKNSSAGYWNYADHFSYMAAGAVSSMQLGNNKWESTQFNSRLQPTQIALGTVQNGTDNLLLNYSYNSTNQNDNNGNVLSQTITVPTIGTNAAFVATQTYTYDSLNRLKSATETIPNQIGWKQTFLYDRYGNRTFDEGGTIGNYATTTLTRSCTTSVYNPNGICDKKITNPKIAVGNNQIVQDQDADLQNDYLFDAVGNTTKDAGNKTFTYDSENKQTKVQNGSTVIGEYSYDGDGKRVKKYVPSTGETTIFIYDAGGKMVAEYSTIVAAFSEAKVSYLTQDNLGSPRITTDANGGVISRRDFMPFGEEVARTSYGTDSVRQKFTSYERDDESSLDFAQARYYNSNLGRFQSPDPLMASAQTRNPQTFNRYSYVVSNPLNLVDPLGLAPCPPGRTCYRNEGDASYIERFIGDDGEEVVTGEPPREKDKPSAELQGPPPPQVAPQVAPQESSASNFIQNIIRSARTGPAFAATLLANELANPSQSVGTPGNDCDAPDSCKEDPEDGLFSRIATPGEKAFQLRQGENGLSVFQQNGIHPIVTDLELLSSFRPGSIIVRISAQQVKGLGLTIAKTLGDPKLPMRLQVTHFEIRPVSGMTRNEFKKIVKTKLP